MDISSNKQARLLRKREDLKRETKSLQRAAKNNAVRTNNSKVKIDYTPQNVKCRSCGDRAEIVKVKLATP